MRFLTPAENIEMARRRLTNTLNLYRPGDEVEMVDPGQGNYLKYMRCRGIVVGYEVEPSAETDPGYHLVKVDFPPLGRVSCYSYRLALVAPCPTEVE